MGTFPAGARPVRCGVCDPHPRRPAGAPVPRTSLHEHLYGTYVYPRHISGRLHLCVEALYPHRRSADRCLSGHLPAAGGTQIPSAV